MRYVYISANLKNYDAISAFDDWKEVYWNEVSNFHFEIGDIVYIYVTPYYYSLAIKAIVKEINIPFKDVKIDDSKYWINKEQIQNLPSKTYAKLSLDGFINCNFDVNKIPGSKLYRKEIKDSRIVYEIERSIAKKAKFARVAFNGDAPNAIHLQKIVDFVGTNGVKYFTTRGRTNIFDAQSHEQICDENGLIVSIKTHGISQKEIARSKLIELGVSFKKDDVTNTLIRKLETAISGKESNIKQDFISFLAKDFHQSSYKYSFLISLIKNLKSDGTANIDEIVSTFSDFYVNRINQGLMPEKYETQVKQALEYWSNFNKMKALIFEPDLSFSSFNKRNFVYKDDEKNIVFINKELWSSLTQQEILSVLNDQIIKRNTYFSNSCFKKHNPHSVESINEDIQDINNDLNISTIEKEVYAKARVGQGKYRKELLELFKNQCAVTNLDLLDLLVASHIKPWRSSSNAEKIDKYNGLLLSSNIDKLFDHGLITFDDNGIMIISSIVTETQRKILQLEKYNKLIVPLNDKQKEYLKYHRSIYFIK